MASFRVKQSCKLISLLWHVQINFEYQPPKIHIMCNIPFGKGWINKTSHRATAKPCGPCMAGCLYQQIYSKSLKTEAFPRVSCEPSFRSLTGSQVRFPPSSSKWGFKVQSFFFFFFFSSKCGGEIMNVETLTCAENWIDCLHV